MQTNEKASMERLIVELENEIKGSTEEKKLKDADKKIEDLISQRNALGIFQIVKKVKLLKEINYQRMEINTIKNMIEDDKRRKQRKIIKLKLKTGELKKHDTFMFGNYHGDIEWLILAIENDKVLLLSKYIVDCMPYNYSKDFVTWDSSNIRNWLNSQFLNTAFTKEEQQEIIMTIVSPDRNFYLSENSASLISDTPQGGFTQDKIFLLSLLESQKLFECNAELYTSKTPYAEQKASDNKANIWWLRTVHKFYMGKYFLGYNATSVSGTEGTASDIGFSVDVESIGVRPAMWLKLD